MTGTQQARTAGPAPTLPPRDPERELKADPLGEAGSGAPAADAVRTLTERLGPLDAATAELLGTVAHQLRTPLTAVAGYVELLAEEWAGPLTGEQERILGIIARNTDRLIGMRSEERRVGKECA